MDLFDIWFALSILSSSLILVLPHSCLSHSDFPCCSLYRDSPSKCCVIMMQHKLRITATPREICLCKGNAHYCVVTLTLCLLSLNVNSVRLSSLSPFLLSVCLIPQPTPTLVCAAFVSSHPPPQFMPGACLLLLPSRGYVPSFFSFFAPLFLPASLLMLRSPFHMCVCNLVSLLSPFFLFLFC